MKKHKTSQLAVRSGYHGLVAGIGELLETARHATARVSNTFMTATYWEVGRRIVEFEQGGKTRAEYGEELLKRLAVDLTARHGRGFGVDNLQRFRALYQTYRPVEIYATLSRKSGADPKYATQLRISGGTGHPACAKSVVPISATPSRHFTLAELSAAFPLPWSTYVRLLSVKSPEAREFYETETLRGGWSIRQLDRQINSLFFERTALSRNKAAMLTKGAKTLPGDALTADEAIRDPLVLEFLGLRDEYSETDLEDALIRHLETFLLELGSDFAFVGRQRRLRIDDEWYRVDLLFFHRRLRCLVVIDLKLGKLTHADTGQMHLYLNYARERWTYPEENPPVGLILCSSAGASLVHYTLDSLPNKVMAREYQLALPATKRLEAELSATRRRLERAGI